MEYTLNKNIVERDLVDKKILLRLDDGEYYSLNEAGAMVWELLKSQHQIENIAQIVSSEYHIDYAKAYNDVRDVMVELKKSGLLIEVEN